MELRSSQGSLSVLLPDSPKAKTSDVSGGWASCPPLYGKVPNQQKEKASEEIPGLLILKRLGGTQTQREAQEELISVSSDP